MKRLGDCSIDYVRGYFDALGIEITELNKTDGILDFSHTEPNKPYYVGRHHADTLDELRQNVKGTTVKRAIELKASVLIWSIWEHIYKGWIIILQP